MKQFALFCLCVTGVWAQTAPQNPLTASSKAIYGIAKNDIMRSAEKVPEEVWSFQPTKEVRTMAQMFAHVADGQYEFCGSANGENLDKGVEKTAKTKADIIAALKTAFAYCDAAYAKITDANAAEMVSFFGNKMARLGIMDFNTAHTFEHYGNLVTYMRLKGIVPPSSEGQK
jgi:uncharacterized damage-inducible protein DinB